MLIYLFEIIVHYYVGSFVFERIKPASSCVEDGGEEERFLARIIPPSHA